MSDACVITVIRHRCHDVLTDADLALLAQPENASIEASSPVVLPDQIGEEIMAVLEAMVERLDRMPPTRVVARRCRRNAIAQSCTIALH